MIIEESTDGSLTIKAQQSKNGISLPDIKLGLISERSTSALSEDWQNVARGSRIEIMLSSQRVMARKLDFPKQAAEFLDGMIRSQIDRLTPWTANDAAFGWSLLSDTTSDRIDVALVATSKGKIQPLSQLAADLGASSVAILTLFAANEGPLLPIKLFENALQGSSKRALSVPAILRGTLLTGGVAAAVAVLVSVYFGDALDSEQQQLQSQISQRRAALRLNSDPAGGSGLELLAKRKQETSSSVMVLEAISKVLPDTTYVTELRIEGDKVQVVGLTQDAPSLIRLMEQSPQFTRATFFAPTTRAQNDPGERFHIEAHINAYFGSGT
ncbi:PilN domain-containing protein [Bradyrhizobium sp. SYSU BS000235]|uniref:PilN domain-containing protein n=1 Tax=Bradyrhizobium sp. SYSU BS000235 TaxID=3411332 RepID=UPI003C73DD90